jgi:hypothetical protein
MDVFSLAMPSNRLLWAAENLERSESVVNPPQGLEEPCHIVSPWRI